MKFEGAVRDVLNFELFKLGEGNVTTGTVFLAVGVIVATLVASRWIQRGTERAYMARGVTDPGTVGATKRLIHYAVLLVGFSMALETAGIRLSGLFAAGAVFAVGLGFAMQTLVQNFVSGVLLLMERSIRPGDILEYEGVICKVERMYIRSTILRTLNDVRLVVPNNSLVQETVRNLSYHQDTVFRIRVPVGVHYESDMARVRVALTEAADQMAWMVKTRTPRIQMREFGDSSVNWEVSVWTQDPWDQRMLADNLIEAIWWRLKRHEITIAYPQMDVHFDREVTGTWPPGPTPSA